MTKKKKNTNHEMTEAATPKLQFSTFFGHLIIRDYYFHLFLNSAYCYT